MKDKIDMVYDLVTKIDERQRTKSERDALRHATEHARMSTIEVDLREHKEGVIQNRSRIKALESNKDFRSKLLTKTTKLLAVLTSIAGVAYTISRILS